MSKPLKPLVVEWIDIPLLMMTVGWQHKLSIRFISATKGHIMSKETAKWLNTETLIGFTDQDGYAWHFDANEQGEESNHYPMAIPVEDVRRRLLDWKPISIPFHVVHDLVTDDGVTHIDTVDPTRQVIIASDTHQVMGAFKAGYQIHDYNEWLIENVERLIAESISEATGEMASDTGLLIGSAGLLRNRAQAWVQMRLSEVEAFNGVEFYPFITAATSLDGSLATTYWCGSQLVVCDNTLSAALMADVPKVKIRHCKHSLGRIDDVSQVLGIMDIVRANFTNQIDVLTNTAVSPSEWDAFLKVHFGEPVDGSKASATKIDRAKASLTGMYVADPRCKPWTGTAFGVLQSVNTWNHWSKRVNESAVNGKMTLAERNAGRVVTGGVDVMDKLTLVELNKGFKLAQKPGMKNKALVLV